MDKPLKFSGKGYLLFLLFLHHWFTASSQQQDLYLVKLKTEYIETPLGIDVKLPRFSWQMNSKTPGSYQKAYQIMVTDQAGRMVWNSERVENSHSLNVKYAGKELSPTTRYNWTLLVWDQNKKRHEAASWFETGLMNPDPLLSGWNGAKWIGGNAEVLPFYAEYLPVFKINFSLQFDERSKSTKAGFIYGANDPRLMDASKNLFRLANLKDSSYIMVELDINPLSVKKAAHLNIFRAGYSSKDNRSIPFKSFPISASIINDQNKYLKHTVNLSSVLGETEIFIDGEGVENRIAKVNLNPLGVGGDYIAFPVLGSIGFNAPKQQTVYFSNVHVRNYRSPSNLLFSAYESPLRIEGGQGGALQITNPSRNSSPMLRTTFSTSASRIAKARLYVTSRGIYEVYINGKRIGKDYFNPGLTQYNKTHRYQTYDVTGDIVQGKNALGAMLAEGWWSGGATYMGHFWNFFGDRQSLLAKLVISYADGKEEVIVSNPSSWSYFNSGPIVSGSFFQGEVYDATKESLTQDWTLASYNDFAWTKAVEVPLAGNISLDKINTRFNMPLVDNYSGMKLIGQCDDAVRKIKELTAIGVEEVRPGSYIYDMGQNIAGVPKITLKGMQPGTKIYLRFAEMKYPDLPQYTGSKGMMMLENIRAAMAQDIYITKGGNEIINPRFTYHGYRYVEINGIEKALPLDAVKAEVLSSVHLLASKYETSNPKVNKLWENITWSTYANFMSIPTDCPQRNERLGWSGDISVFSRTATYLANVPQFLRRHMEAMRDVQREDGRFTDVAPLGGGFGGVLWGSAGITVAWESYQQFGDKELLKEHYESMKQYVEFVKRSIDPKTNVINESDRGKWEALGDWLSPDYNKTEKSLLWESYFIYDLNLMSKIASILGNKEDMEYFDKLKLTRKDFFNKTYVDSGGVTRFRDKIIDTQASYALPFAFNIFDTNKLDAAKRNFTASVERETKADNDKVYPPLSLMTGFIGTAWISTALSDNGNQELAYRLLQQTSYPSWLYSVEQGATTIWERLNSYTHTEGFGGNNQMNSFNHYSFGAVGAWMYDHSLGIRRDENEPGFKHFLLVPEPDPSGEMTFAKGYYDSMYGRIESSWKVEGGDCLFNFTVPANTSATLYLKAKSVKDIIGRNKLLSKTKGVRSLRAIEGKYRFELVAGSYSIKVLNHQK